MMWWNGNYGWGGWLLMSLLMVAFWGLVIVGGISLWRSANRRDRGNGGGRRPDSNSPEQLLDQRFARGEIDVDEYTGRRDLLRAGR